MPACDDLRLGGTLASTGLTGGISINNTALSVADWSSLFGTVGQSAQSVSVYGRPGWAIAGDRLPLGRLLTLDCHIHAYPSDQSACTSSELALMENTDEFLALCSARGGTYLEVDLPDNTSRFTHIVNLLAGPNIQAGPFRRYAIPFDAAWGFWWEGGAESSEVVTGADTVTVGGTQIVYDAVLEFAGDGTFAHADGWGIEVTGSSGVVTVFLGGPGGRTVFEGGVPVMNRIRRTVVPGEGRVWGWFNAGANSVTATGSAVTVKWRDQWL